MASYTRETLIRDVLVSNPDAIAVFERHGLPCAHCMASEMETLSSVAVMHDISVDALLKDLEALEQGCEEAGGDD